MKTATLPNPSDDNRLKDELKLKILELNSLARERYYRGESPNLSVIRWPEP